MNKYEIYIGTYASRDIESVLKFEVDFDKKTFTPISGIKGLWNPSYLIFNKDRSRMYVVEEDPEDGFIATLKKEGDTYVLVDEQHVDAADPCHLSLSEDEAFLGVASYSSGPGKGGFNLYRLDEDGIPQLTCKIRPEGGSIHPVRQLGSHCHSIYFHGDRVDGCDFGTDTVFSFDLDRESGELKVTDRTKKTMPGSGPRHIAFDEQDPNWMYVADELDGLVRCFHLEHEKNIEIQSVNTLPDDLDAYVRKENRTGAIRMTSDSKYLVVTNRLDDSLTLIGVDEKHRMTVLDICSCAAVEPRELTLFGDYMLVGYHESQCVNAFKIDRENGKLVNLDMCYKFDMPSICVAEY